MSGASPSAGQREQAGTNRVSPPPGLKWRRLRFVPLGIAAAALLTGLWVGLARLGLALPGGMPVLAEFHGALMISGFLGTVISLERAVAIGRWWAYAAPALSGLGALALLAGVPPLAAAGFLLAGLALTINSMVVVVRQPALFSVALAVAAACWAIGTAAWILGWNTAELTGWWLAFLVLTVAAERLELSRLLSPPRLSQVTFACAAALILIGAARRELAGNPALFSGMGLIGATLWLLKHDVALRTVRQLGQTRFSATCMISGYVWLGAAGLLLLLAPPGTAAFTYDAAVHAIAIGFIFSMIFGHAPIILPAVTGLRVGFSGFAYAPLALLHVSVLLRVAGDLLAWTDLRAGTGPLTMVALAGYAGTLIVASRARRQPVR
ncbi:hypothetical protein [Hyphomicrobium sp.]|uniref:hypothetical protein n=1 Tax=Hyphomicrobium sp. TaxID=82 RepID=UPI0025B92EAC|nr:hypothetical protein [Hyphomicrobium sp.]